MKAKMFTCIFLIAGIFLLSSCAPLTKKESGISKEAEVLEPSILTKFSDIPVPSGFKFQPQDSYSFENSGLRVGVLKYRGKAYPEQVISFYKEQMPMYNWNLLNIIEYGERLLNFERESETCIITLSGKGNNITSTISIGPKNQLPGKSSKTVK